jgi:hypothetical protein
MGIARPYEAEIDELGPPPGFHAPLDMGGRITAFVEPSASGVRVGDHHLRVADPEDPAAVARELRSSLYRRFLERRPMADEHTWESFTAIVRGIVRDRTTADGDLLRLLLEAIDGL